MRNLLIVSLVFTVAVFYPNSTKAQEVNWTSWEYVHCGNGLMLKYAKTGYNEYAKKWRWEVKFKNPTGQKIHFNFGAGPFVNKGSIKTTRRMRLGPSEESDIGHSFLVDDANSVWFPVDKMRIGEVDLGSCVDCHGNSIDKKKDMPATNSTTTQNNTSNHEDSSGIDYSSGTTSNSKKTKKKPTRMPPDKILPGHKPGYAPQFEAKPYYSNQNQTQKTQSTPPVVTTYSGSFDVEQATTTITEKKEKTLAQTHQDHVEKNNARYYKWKAEQEAQKKVELERQAEIERQRQEAYAKQKAEFERKAQEEYENWLKEQERQRLESERISQAYDQLGDEVGYELGTIFTGEFSPQSMLNITQSVLNSGLISSVDGILGASLAGGVGAAVIGFAQQAKKDKIKRNLNSLKSNLESHKEAYSTFQQAVKDNDNAALLETHERLQSIETSILDNADYLIYKADQSELKKLVTSIKDSRAKRNEGVAKVKEAKRKKEQRAEEEKLAEFYNSGWDNLIISETPTSLSYDDIMRKGVETRKINDNLKSIIRFEQIKEKEKASGVEGYHAKISGFSKDPFKVAVYDPKGRNQFNFISDEYAFSKHILSNVIAVFDPNELSYSNKRPIVSELLKEEERFGENSKMMSMTLCKMFNGDFYKLERMATNEEDNTTEVRIYYYSTDGLLKREEVYVSPTGKLKESRSYSYKEVDGYLFWDILTEENATVEKITQSHYYINENNVDKRRSFIQETLDNQMVNIEGGNFKVGGKIPILNKRGKTQPKKEVLVDDFQISKFEITHDLWMAVMNDFWKEEGIWGEYANPSNQKLNRMPVVASYESVQLFIRKLNDITEKRYRLPTEAEWEYAAKTGGWPNFSYSGSNVLNKVAWYGRNAYGEIQPVGLLKPNKFDLYDMSGNVWEWCSDNFSSEYPYPVIKGGDVQYEIDGGYLKLIFMPSARDYLEPNKDYTYYVQDALKKLTGFRLAHD